MSTSEALVTVTLEAGADLSAKQFYAVKINTSSKAVLAAAGEVAIGILQNKPTSGQSASIAISGKSKAVFGASATVGGPVASDASGKLVNATKASTNTGDAGGATDALVGSNVLGLHVAGGTADLALGEVLLMHLGAVPTTVA